MASSYFAHCALVLHSFRHNANEESFKRWCHENLDSFLWMKNAYRQTMNNLHQHTIRMPANISSKQCEHIQILLCCCSRIQVFLSMPNFHAFTNYRLWLPSYITLCLGTQTHRNSFCCTGRFSISFAIHYTHIYVLKVRSLPSYCCCSWYLAAGIADDGGGWDYHAHLPRW